MITEENKLKVKTKDFIYICESVVKKVLKEELEGIDISTEEGREQLANDYAIKIETLNGIIDACGGDLDDVINELEQQADINGYGWDSNNTDDDYDYEADERMKRIWRDVTNGGRYPSGSFNEENTFKKYIKNIVREEINKLNVEEAKKLKYDDEDYIKANRKGSREAEKEMKGDGFKRSQKVHKTAKEYNRKGKDSWKPTDLDEANAKLYNLIETMVKNHLK